ncbi:hypothetical protein H920_15064 [Fukomys damarensis]|uniref:Uncharacterized protein n=1 Tax=Fukomys damarensis TaxID=885580 RepID=A0A091CXN7_FUKDA|nr:hypothetical protein H920_15064 [Fukomys damarensis]
MMLVSQRLELGQLRTQHRSVPIPGLSHSSSDSIYTDQADPDEDWGTSSKCRILPGVLVGSGSPRGLSVTELKGQCVTSSPCDSVKYERNIIFGSPELETHGSKQKLPGMMTESNLCPTPELLLLLQMQPFPGSPSPELHPAEIEKLPGFQSQEMGAEQV